MKLNIKHFHEMYKIRLFEEKLLKIFSEGKITGTTHTYIGQEATAVAIFQFINDDDIIVSNHRSHGPPAPSMSLSGGGGGAAKHKLA